MFLTFNVEETALSSCRFHFLLQEYVQLKAQAGDRTPCHALEPDRPLVDKFPATMVEVEN